MKKTFPLQVTGRDDARVRDKIRQTVNSTVRRSRRRAPVEGFDGWDFKCKVGVNEPNAARCSLKEVGRVIEDIAQLGVSEIYVEVVAVPIKRGPTV
ncbi:MAG: DUF6172 family protein [Candidatus Didemnitutus sp.]|nr:DUF6172 family protein [Candidatus Didemnitutus sp.]